MPFDMHGLMRIYASAQSKKSSHKKRGFKIKVDTDIIANRMYKALYNGCDYCGCEMQIAPTPTGHQPASNLLTLDVVNPSTRTLSEDNMAIVCCRCNLMKGSMDYDDFLWHCGLISEGLMGGK